MMYYRKSSEVPLTRLSHTIIHYSGHATTVLSLSPPSSSHRPMSQGITTVGSLAGPIIPELAGTTTYFGTGGERTSNEAHAWKV